MESLSYLVDASLIIEKLRVASEVRISHLANNKRTDKDTEELHERIEDLEKFVDGKVAGLIKSHPAYPWFSKVKGIGKENIGKVVAPIDINRADTISALWRFAGFSVEDGKAPKRLKGGGKLHYNSQLRSMCWRLGTSLLRARGKFYDYYLKEKDKYGQKYENIGKRIVPTTSLPTKDKKRYEPEDMISEGHVHNQALRKMIKLFLACLWLEWRAAEGLPVREPYAIGQLKHDGFIDPKSMIDR